MRSRMHVRLRAGSLMIFLNVDEFMARLSTTELEGRHRCPSRLEHARVQLLVCDLRRKQQALRGELTFVLNFPLGGGSAKRGRRGVFATFLD